MIILKKIIIDIIFINILFNKNIFIVFIVDLKKCKININIF